MAERIRQLDDSVGGHRARQRGERARRWWAVSLLAIAVAATSFMVPLLVSPIENQSAVTPATVSAPAVMTSPEFQPEFHTVRIAATDPGNERFGVETTVCPTCASGSRVQYLGQGHALAVHVRGIPVAGRRTLTLVYETNGVRPLDVSVNGGTTISLKLPGKQSWTTPAEFSLPIDLPAGDTVIKLFHANLPAPDIDQIVIS